MTVLRKSSAISTIVIMFSTALASGCADDITPLGVGGIDPAGSDEPVIDAGLSAGANAQNETGTDVVGTISEELNPVETVPETDTVPEFSFASSAIENAALLFISENNGPTGLSVSSSARFYSLATPLGEDPVLKSMTMLDSCEVGSEASQVNADALDLPIDHLLEASGTEILQVASVSAGDTVELESDAGSFVSLLKTSLQSSIEYTVQDGTDLNMMVPDALDMIVTGDDFPQLTGSWTTPARLDADIQDAVRTIDTTPVLSWTAADSIDSEQSRLHIYAGFLDELTGEFNSYQCVLADDGEFTLPEDVQALYNGGLNANFVDVARYTRSVQLIEGISVVNVFVQRF